MAATINSGSIRRSLAMHIRHLGDRIGSANTAIADDIPNTLDGCEDLHDVILQCIEKLQSSIKSIQEKDAEWQQLHHSCTDQDAVKEDEIHYDKLACGNDGYVELLLQADSVISDLNMFIRKINRRKTALNEASAPVLQAASVNAASGPPQTMTVKPPKLQLPTFSGDILKWKQFWSIFNSNIHSKSNLTGVEKFSYLIPLLKGEARDAIDGLIIDDDNYDCAIDILTQLYDRSGDRIVSLLYGELKKMPPSTKTKESKRKTYNGCERIFRQLESAGQDLDSNASLTLDLLSKFPDQMVRDLHRYYEVSFSSKLSKVRIAIEKSISEQELTYGLLDDLHSMRPNAEDSRQTPKTPKTNPGSKYPNNRDGSMAAQAQRHFPPSSPCYFCNGPHQNADCTKYSTVGARKKRLQELKRCVRCLKLHARQDPKNCRFPIRCYLCKTEGQHVPALCPSVPKDGAAGSKAGAYGPAAGSSAGGGNAFPKPKPDPFPQGGTTSKDVKDQNSAVLQKILETVKSLDKKELQCLNNSSSKHSLYQTAKAWLINPQTGERILARLCFDTLSNRTYITENTAQKLNLLHDRTERLSVSVFGSTKNVSVSSAVVSFGVLEIDGSVRAIQANTTRIISDLEVIPNQWPDAEKELLNALSERNALADNYDDSYQTLDVLIGADYTWDFIVGPKLPTHTKISLIPSTLGLMLAGRLSDGSESDGEPVILAITESVCQFPSELGLIAAETKHITTYPDVDEFWKLETIGIRDDPVVTDDERALKQFSETIHFEQGRYQVQWPWIEEKKILLPTNFELAIRRFRAMTKRIKENPELLTKYQDIIQLQLDHEIIERVPDNEIHSKNVVHYLPHHAVFKPTSNTTKIRIVYDASSKVKKSDVSLNECMLRGPVILPDLCQCLIRFRTSEVVVISDLEKAYLQVGLQRSDRDVTRFLWFKDPSVLSVENNTAVYRFCRVAFGIISSSFLLGATIQHHLDLEGTEFAKNLKDDVHVDNIISGVSGDDGALDYYRQSKDIFQRAGMNLMEFCSNSAILMNSLPERDRIKNPDARVLGLQWDSQNDDSLRIPVPQKWTQNSESVSKRQILQSIASVFDPLGLFQPIMLEAKLLLQLLWGEKLGWDAKVSEEIAETWEEIKLSIAKIFEFRIPRFVGSICEDSCLIVFSDASIKAYAATVYLRTRDVSGNWVSNLIFAKSRLAPPTSSGKTISMPRLELMAAVIGAHAGKFCRDAVRADLPIHFFIDSECVLHWIRSGQNLESFVARRVDSIRAVNNCTFNYVVTHENPADYNTRGKTPDELFADPLWWHGPSWLLHDEWPIYNIPSMSDREIRDVVSREKPPNVITQTLLADADPSLALMGIDPKRCASLQKLLHVTVFCIRFLKKKLWNKLSDNIHARYPSLQKIFGHVSDDKITADSYDLAKHLWVKKTQQDFFAKEFEAIEGRGRSSLVVQLNVRVDDNGILRSHSRYANADLPANAKFPKLLPSKSVFTALVVEDVHRKLLHSGVSHTLSMIRREFWIIHGRSTVKRILTRCHTCIRYKTGTPFALPDMPAWPHERVCRSFPFQFVGLDYFGPMLVKVHEEKIKMWCCLFTCLTTRAVHLEAVTDCSSREFLNALIRFISRRGCPEQIISDNAAQFRLVSVLADKAWKQVPRDEAIVSYIAHAGIRWKFIIELAPWQGGHYERLVGVVKSVLKTAIGRRCLTWTDLITLLAETEAVVNSRPITYVPSDVDSDIRVLRPIDFLTELPAGIDQNSDPLSPREVGEGGKQLISVWKQRKRHLDKLWQTWYAEYLLNLRETGKAKHRSGRSDKRSTPFCGQIVLVHDPDLPRGSWKLAKVVKPIISRDSSVRAAEIRLANGVILRRAVNLLIPLELENFSAGEGSPDDDTESPVGTSTPAQDAMTGSASSGPNAASTERSTASATAGSTPDAPSPIVQPGSDDDDEEFLGFSPADVLRVAQALQMYDGIGDYGDDDGESLA